MNLKKRIKEDKSFDLDKLKERLQGRILSEIEPLIAQTMREENLAYYDLSEKKNIIASKILPTISKMFEREYGLSLYSFVISKIFIPKKYLSLFNTQLANGQTRFLPLSAALLNSGNNVFL